jgi:hypothetical protein
MEAEGYGYESAMGRAYWLSRDPIGERGGINFYGMVGNDPVNRVDYLGLLEGKFDYAVTEDDDKYRYDYIFKGESGQVISQDVSLNVEFKCDSRQLATIGTTYREVFTMARSGTGGPDTHQVGIAALLRQVKDHVCGDRVGAGCKEVTFSGTQKFSVFTNPTLNKPGLISPFGGFSYTGAASSNIGGPGISDYPPNDWPPSVNPTDLTADGGKLAIGITHEFSGIIDPCKCTGKMSKHPAHDNYK